MNAFIGRLHTAIFGPCDMHLWVVIDKVPCEDFAGDACVSVTLQCYKCGERKARLIERGKE